MRFSIVRGIKNREFPMLKSLIYVAVALFAPEFCA